MPPKRGRSGDRQGSRKRVKFDNQATTAASTEDVKVAGKGNRGRLPKAAASTSEEKVTTKQASFKAEKSTTKKKGQKQGKSSSLDELPTTSPSDSWLFDLITDKGWKRKLAPCFHTDKFKEMETWVKTQYKKSEVFPPKELIFNAFNLTSFDTVKIVILGQDPYHDNGQAMGMSFSVPRGIAIPPSLKNIYKELEKNEKGFSTPDHGCLEKWAKEGVLMLNAALTVEAHKANSHARCGWWDFTDNIIKIISEQMNNAVFILWGNFAHKKEALIDTSKHAVIKTAHPSPLSFSKFYNCKCFVDANAALVRFGKTAVDWKLD